MKVVCYPLDCFPLWPSAPSGELWEKGDCARTRRGGGEMSTRHKGQGATITSVSGLLRQGGRGGQNTDLDTTYVTSLRWAASLDPGRIPDRVQSDTRRISSRCSQWQPGLSGRSNLDVISSHAIVSRRHNPRALSKDLGDVVSA